jgi:peptidoglycan-N-acetylglucosamine deacetylase
VIPAECIFGGLPGWLRSSPERRKLEKSMHPETARFVAETLGGLAAAGLAVGGCAYAALWPESQIFGSTLVSPQRSGELALTFDDGPNPAWTPQLLETLAKHRVKATFFLVGKYAEAEPYLTRYIAESGHVIGNHSWSHSNLALTSPKRVREELLRTKHLLEEITGSAVRFFRPPYGARRPDVLMAARDLGMDPVLWNAMTSDWKEPSAQRIVDRLSARVDALGRRGGSATVVLHDGGHLSPGADREASVLAAEKLIQRYMGVRRFVTAEYLRWGA